MCARVSEILLHALDVVVGCSLHPASSAPENRISESPIAPTILMIADDFLVLHQGDPMRVADSSRRRRTASQLEVLEREGLPSGRNRTDSSALSA
jgi:hypothetical protein